MITPKLLVSLDACEEQYRIFVDEWPDGAEVTVANVLRAIEIDLDLDWFINKFFTPAARTEYVKAIGAAWTEYEKTTAPARAEYEKATAPARAEYEKVRDAARTEYRKVRAEAFVTAYKITVAETEVIAGVASGKVDGNY